jgi:hypothetical protein
MRAHDTYDADQYIISYHTIIKPPFDYSLLPGLVQAQHIPPLEDIVRIQSKTHTVYLPMTLLFAPHHEGHQTNAPPFKQESTQ